MSDAEVLAGLREAVYRATGLTMKPSETYVVAKALLAAGWSRPVPAVGRSEAEIRAAGDAVSHPAVRAFMAAMVPEVKADAWDEAVRECHALGWLHDFALSDALARNPYHAARVAGTTDAGGRDE